MNSIVIPDLTSELNDIKRRLESLEAKILTMFTTRERQDTLQLNSIKKGALKNG